MFFEQKRGMAWFLDPGMGKTAMSLELINSLRDFAEAKRVLIVAPLRVTELVWPKEVAKWDYDFTVSRLHGDKKGEALRRGDVHLINPEGLTWLVHEAKAAYDLVIFDESTKFKNWSSQRTKAARKLKTRNTMILTGTPAPNCLSDLYAQIYLIDRGEALGKNLTQFRSRFMYQGGYENREWFFRPEMENTLNERIGEMVYQLKAEDHLDMPEQIINEIDVTLPPSILKAYKQFEKEMYCEIEGKGIIAFQPGGKYNLCRQIASGGFYDENRVANTLHEVKLDALEDLYDELHGKPLLVGYSFLQDWDRIKKRFKHARTINGSVSSYEAKETLALWRDGSLTMLACQADSMGHGIDGIQDVCSDVCWYSVTDKPEIHKQFNTRVYRQGQRDDTVRIHYLLAQRTVDKTIFKRLQSKDQTQQEFLRLLKELQNAE